MAFPFFPLDSGALFSFLRAMPDWVAIILLGIIEGITEFLPISSTGHLLIVQHWLPRQSDLFNVVIQAGAVLAVLPLFPQRLEQFISRWREPATLSYLLKLAVAFGITAAGGAVMEYLDFQLPEKILPVALALLTGGVLFLVVEYRLKNQQLTDLITWKVAAAVGIGQLVAAFFPGTSRSGATILIALMMGLTRPAAVEFTFLVGIPTMLAASSVKILKSFKSPSGPQEDWAMLALGFTVSAVVSFFVVGWLLRYVRTHTFVAFGYYRIGLALALLILLAAGW